MEEEEEEHKAGRMADVRISCRRKRTDRKWEEQQGLGRHSRAQEHSHMHAYAAAHRSDLCMAACACLPSEL